jgi:hypothetical protein
MTNILIHVEGGMVQGVFSDSADVDVTLIDYDNIEGGEEELINFNNYPVTVTNLEKMKKIINNANNEIQLNNNLLEEN